MKNPPALCAASLYKGGMKLMSLQAIQPFLVKRKVTNFILKPSLLTSHPSLILNWILSGFTLRMTQAIHLSYSMRIRSRNSSGGISRGPLIFCSFLKIRPFS